MATIVSSKTKEQKVKSKFNDEFEDYLKAQCERLEKRLDEREETNKRLLDLITNNLK